MEKPLGVAEDVSRVPVTPGLMHRAAVIPVPCQFQVLCRLPLRIFALLATPLIFFSFSMNLFALAFPRTSSPSMNPHSLRSAAYVSEDCSGLSVSPCASPRILLRVSVFSRARPRYPSVRLTLSTLPPSSHPLELDVQLLRRHLSSL